MQSNNFYLTHSVVTVDAGVSMNNVDKVTRDSRILVDSAKDTVTKNLVLAARNDTVSLTKSQLETIISIVNLSFDEGYQRALPAFQNAIKKFVP